jgi:polyisoprenoid-binding protein YceI
MKGILLNSIFLLLFTIASNAQNASLKTKKFSVAFQLKNMGLNVKGSFKTGSIAIKYDEKNPSNSSFVGSVLVKSIHTGIDLRDKHLLEKSEYFQPETYSEIKMESTAIKVVDGKTLATFNLTMKGITKVVTTPIVAIANADATYAFQTTFTINRRDWLVGNKSMMMSDKIDININAVASKN